MNKYFVIFFLLIFASAEKMHGQQKIKGQAIPEYGEIYTVPNPDLDTSALKEYKAVFDLYTAPEDPAALNAGFDRVARFINLHVEAGIPIENIKPVMVVHGGASMGLLKNEFYNEKFGVDNPNIELLNKLDEVGVAIVLCGQTAGAREISKEKRLPQIQLALSAMTALIYYQDQGYGLINF
ncbi:MAG: DsrE family protein [Leeuwenhoekiella sp.]